MMNGIYTTAEYIAQGFRPEEVPEIRKVDWLNFKRKKAGTLSEKQERLYDELVKKLRL